MKRLRKSLRLCAFILALMMLLPMGYGLYSQLVYGTRWRTSEYNTYLSSMKSSVTAGSIYDRAGVLLAATEVSTDAEGAVTRTRVYAADETVRRAVAHAVGDTRGTVKNAAESFFAEYLYGAKNGYLERLIQLAGGSLRGDDITLSLDSRLCAYIASIFPQDKNGAVVVMNYKTGELFALQSFPSFDPATGRATVNQALNRATRWVSAPGSTFKIVTLTAALQNIAGAEAATYTCTGGVIISENERTVSDYAGEAHGTLTLKQAFAKSCNSTFAILALTMKDKALRRTAESFGVGDDFTFRDLVVENSAYASTAETLLGADLAWTGAGQNQLALTPLHMCMIAAAVANDGVMMEPRLLLRAVSPTGVERVRFEPVAYRTVMSGELAETVRGYMREVVVSGTGRSAAVSGLTVCAKTGTAEIDTQENDNAWFVGFIDDDSLPYAVCVVVQEGGTGGSVAAPLAQKIFRYLSRK
ncbi:MAG: penicillin-binding protein 2 [Clostridia bacterium]|nr:penicillin-binding protein 2 [Clostridia bacterium]